MSSKMGVNISLFLSHSFVCGQSFSFAVWHFKYFCACPTWDLALSPKCQVWGEQGSGCGRELYFCHTVIGHCARKCQCRSKPEFFHLSQDKVLIRVAAATLARCHCCCQARRPLGERDYSGQAAQNWNFLQFFHGFDLGVALSTPPTDAMARLSRWPSLGHAQGDTDAQLCIVTHRHLMSTHRIGENWQ